MIDVVFVHPGGAGEIYGPLADELAAVEPPLWARLLAAHARDSGHRVRIVDAEAMRLTPAAAARAALFHDPRLVVLVAFGHQPSASTQQMPAARATAVAIRDANADVPILLVGGHPSALPARTLEEEPVTYVCDGEGPITVDALLRGDPARLDLGDVPGLVWRDGDRVARNPKAVPLDLAALNGEAWDLLPIGRYRAHNWQCLGGWPRAPYASIYTSLGCPFGCSFCCINAPFGKPGYRKRPPRDVAWDIVRLYKDRGVRTFKIVDELFVLDDRHVEAVCDWLIAWGIGERINIWAYARTDTVRTERLEKMRRAGIRWLALGIESASDAVLSGVDKRIKGDPADAVCAIQDAGISVIGNYIFGLPDDDEASMRATLDLAMSLNTEFANFYCAMAYPGSALYDPARIDLPESWSGYSQHSYDCRPLDTKYISGVDVLRFRDEAFQAYFSWARYRERVGRKFGPRALAEIDAMLARGRPRRKLLEDAIFAESTPVQDLADVGLAASGMG